MIVDYLFRVVHAAVTDVDIVLVEDFPELVVFGEVFCVRVRNLCPMLVLVLFSKKVAPHDVVRLSLFRFACFGWFVM